jgi:hypothetical protein
VGLIKMCLNETYCRVRIGKKSVRQVYYWEWPETRRCFITTAFQFCFAICHQEGPREPGGTEIEWDTSAFGLCGWC